MRQLWIVLAAFFVLGECRRFRSDDEGEVKTNCVNKDVDKYLDEVLEKARKELDDPMRLPPRASIVDLTDGVLWGMSELKRIGTAEVICEEGKVIIKAKMTVDELKGRYTWVKERRGSKEPRVGYVVFISDDFEAEATVVIERKDGEVTHPRLEKFHINKFKKAKVEVTGMNYFTWALGELTTLFSGIFHRVIARTVEGPMREALERELRDVNLD